MPLVARGTTCLKPEARLQREMLKKYVEMDNIKRDTKKCAMCEGMEMAEVSGIT